MHNREATTSIECEGYTIPILYEDNHIIVVVKPENMPVCKDKSEDFDLLSAIKLYIKEKYKKPGDVYLGLVHRLDRPVGGVMVFARTSKAASRLSAALRKRDVKKSYAAIVDGTLKGAARLTGYMRSGGADAGCNAGGQRVFKQELFEEGAEGKCKYAELSYQVAGARFDLSLLDVELDTGRKHQIRVQLAQEGFAIWGDRRYNGRFIEAGKAAGDIALYAYALSFTHPTLKMRMRFFNAPTNERAPWNEFKDELKVLCAGFLPIYIDDGIIVINKPRGIQAAQADVIREGERSVEGELQAFFPEAKAVHRLDATTEGVMLVGRGSEASLELERLFNSDRGGKNVKKIYRAEVVGGFNGVAREGELRHYMVKDSERARAAVYDSLPADANAKSARLYYRVIGAGEHSGEVETTAVQVELITGRTHQIRAQFAHIGHPLLGDDRYGDREVNRLLRVRAPQLYAERIEILDGRWRGMIFSRCD